MNKDYHIKCPHCGFDFCLLCDESDFEENKEAILQCPCGKKAEIIRIRKCGEYEEYEYMR